MASLVFWHSAVRFSFLCLDNDGVCEIIRIYNPECEGMIDKSVPRITVWHHEPCRVMTNGDPRDKFFYSTLTRIMDTFSCSTLFYVFIIPPANFVCRGYTVFTLSVRLCVRASVRPSVTFCFLNNSKSHSWIFIKPCKHVHICKTNTLDKKVRARGQFYLRFFPL